LQHKNTEEWVMNVFKNKVHPQLFPIYEEIEIDDAKRVGIIIVPRGDSKPYVVIHNDREEFFIRLGSTSRTATREQIFRLFESGGILHSEEMPVRRSNFETLDEARLKDYLQNIIGENELPLTKQEWEIKLSRLGFMVDNTLVGEYYCTIAGLVLFGRNPRNSLLTAGVRWMSFEGNDLDYKAQDDTFISAPLVPLYQSIGGGRQLIQPGLIEQITDRMRPFISVEWDHPDENFRKDRDWFYSPDAVREAIINAISHRDWTRSVEVEIVNYNDRLEITSPGALNNSITLEKMLAGQRSSRNQLIVSVLRDYGYVDMRGMGIRRKIIPLTRELTGTDPIFEAAEDYVKTILPRKKVSE
jgi:ATP-dependent DNA helicase RecG